MTENIDHESPRCTAAAQSDHVPDRSRLNNRVSEWQPMDLNRAWHDGTQLLVAVPVNCRLPNARKRDQEHWFYEYAVIVIHTDEDYFAIEHDGEAWGWDLNCVDWYIVLSE